MQQPSEIPEPISIDTGAGLTLLVAALMLVLRLRQIL
jgi:hypothetical protein